MDDRPTLEEFTQKLVHSLVINRFIVYSIACSLLGKISMLKLVKIDGLQSSLRQATRSE